MEHWSAVAVAALLIAAFITDLHKQVIPNRLTAFFFGAAMLYQLFVHSFDGILTALAGAAAGFGPLLLLYICKGIGAGDVKLFATVGAWTGVWVVLQLMFYAILYAGAIGIVLLLFNRAFAKKMAYGFTELTILDAGKRKYGLLKWAESGQRFPFMLAVAPAAATVWVQIQ